jgi:hypothetical protein
MAATLKTVVAQSPGLVNYIAKEVKVCVDTIPNPRPGQDPCIYEYQKQPYTQIKSALQMDVVYLPAGNPAGATDQGHLSYTITCSYSSNCNLCKSLATGLNGASVLTNSIPAIGTVFGLVAFITTGECMMNGC